MNKTPKVALCWMSGVSPHAIDSLKNALSGFSIQAGFLIDNHLRLNQREVKVFRPLKGFDMLAVLTDHVEPHTEFELLTYFNGSFEDPWPMCVLSLSSSSWKGPQPLIGIERSRYFGHFLSENLPDLLQLLTFTRSKFHDRGFTEDDWKVIQSLAGTDRWEYILKLRNL